LRDFETIFARSIPEQDQRPVQLKEHEAMMAAECERNAYTRGPPSGILGELGMKIFTTRGGAGMRSPALPAAAIWRRRATRYHKTDRLVA
jgi:hypothetical protein